MMCRNGIDHFLDLSKFFGQFCPYLGMRSFNLMVYSFANIMKQAGTFCDLFICAKFIGHYTCQVCHFF